MENGLRRPSFLRVIVALAAVVVVLVGMRIAAPILNPILFAVVLALLFGLSRAVLVISGVVVINVLAENVLSPMMMGRGPNLSPTVVFLSFILWAWVLGGPGAFLAVPITMFVIGMQETFPETRWLANLMGAGASAPGAEPPVAGADREP